MRDTLVVGTGGEAAGVATQDKPAFLEEIIAVNGTFGWEVDWAAVAFEMHGSTGPPGPNSLPIADFSYVCSDLVCNFIDGSSDGDGSIASQSWYFDDLSTSTAENPSHTYAAGGTYNVTLTVTDDDGATDSASQSVTVIEPNQPPAAPSNLTANVQSTGHGKKKVVTGVVLSWADNSNDEVSFVVERCEETGKGKNKTCIFTEIETVGANVTTLSDAPDNGRFKYRVKARNVNDVDSAYSNAVKV
jgi:PKD repeat protein